MNIGVRVERAIWGTERVRCEECGAVLRSHSAVWRGAHPYCSWLHELQDHDELLALT